MRHEPEHFYTKRSPNLLRTIKCGLWLSAAVACAALPGSVEAKTEAKTPCKENICLQLTHSKHEVHATPGFRGTGWDHFNVTVNGAGAIKGGQQFEARGPFTFPRVQGTTLIFIQACSGAGLGQRSTCTPRPAARFKYTVNSYVCPKGEACGSITQY
jgi:hypothetical protein